LVKWKLLIGKVSTKEKAGGWESDLEPEEEEEFRALLTDMDKTRKIRFPRNIPQGKAS
jgi:hypothetical protein